MTGPALSTLIADVERQLATPLARLSATVADGELDEPTLRRLNAAANHVSCALNRLAGIETPARRMQTTAPSGVPGTTPVREHPDFLLGDVAARGPVQPPAGSEGGRAGGGAVLVQAPGAVRESVPGSGGAARGGPGADFNLPRIERRAGESRPYSRIGLAGQQVGTALYRGGIR